MTTGRRIAFGFLLLLGVGACLFALGYQSILRATGAYLVESQTPEKADAILVLAGDWRGNRVMRAAELVAGGYVSKALVSSPLQLYGVQEGDLAIQWAVRHGAPATHFEAVYIHATSTLEEARAVAPELKKRQVRKLLLVTSDSHSHRAASIFRRVLGPGVEVRSIIAPDPFFSPDSWWHNREGQKTVFYEYSKTIAGWLGM